MRRILAAVALCLFGVGVAWSASPASFDLIIRGGTVHDGSGGPGRVADVGISADRIALVGDLSTASAPQVIDAAGQVVSPGFINVLSWSNESLIADGRGMSVLKQGVTLEVMGEGTSMGPLTEAMREEALRRQAEIRYDIPWSSFGEYFEFLERRGISVNVASFVGAATLRIHEVGYDDREASTAELEAMKALVRTAMEEGALGVGSSLIYPPATFASERELIELTRAAAEYGGGYITHMRSEADRYLESIEETIRIADAADTWAQIYHLKPAGRANWDKQADGIALMDAAREAGTEISANVYTYTAGATGLDAAFPPWSQAGGHDAWIARLKDPEQRARIEREMADSEAGYENLYLLAGAPEQLILLGFNNPELRQYTGRTLAEVAALRGTDPIATMVDLVIADDSRVDTAYVLMSEDNLRRNIAWPHTMFGSDAAAMAPEPPFTLRNPHPRGYGNFARLLGRYVREAKLLSLEEAIRRLTTLPATSLRLENRGCLKPGCFADLVVFDPETITDTATFAEPHQYAEGVDTVVVNGVVTLRAGEHTGAYAGRFVRGSGYR